MGNQFALVIKPNTKITATMDEVQQRLTVPHPWMMNGLAMTPSFNTEMGVMHVLTDQSADSILSSLKVIIQDNKFQKFVDICQALTGVVPDKNIFRKPVSAPTEDTTAYMFMGYADRLTEIREVWDEFITIPDNMNHDVFSDPGYFGPALQYIGSVEAGQTMVVKAGKGQFIPAVINRQLEMPSLAKMVKPMQLAVEQARFIELEEYLQATPRFTCLLAA